VLKNLSSCDPFPISMMKHRNRLNHVCWKVAEFKREKEIVETQFLYILLKSLDHGRNRLLADLEGLYFDGEFKD
jgi:hypothetical protein